MPFKSEKQRRYLWKFHPDIARRWTEEMKRNPASTGFRKIARGTFSDVYSNDSTVEVIVLPDRHGSVDVSKDIVVEVRELVSENAQRFLPQISRDRYESGEFIYTMPFYEPCKIRLGNDLKLVAKDASLQDQVLVLASYFSEIDLAGIVEAMIALREKTSELGLKYINDFSTRNLAMSGDQLILLDIFYAESASVKLLKQRWINAEKIKVNLLKQLLKHLTQLL